MSTKHILITLVTLLFISSRAMAAEIKITKFEKLPYDLTASKQPAKDNAGKYGALLRFKVSDKKFEIEPNLGILRKENKTGEILLWVPVGTKMLTVRHEGAYPLDNYQVPVKLEEKVVYEVRLEFIGDNGTVVSEEGDNPFYLRIGYSVMPLSGPTGAVGIVIGGHNIEVGATYGLAKTDDLFFYDNQQKLLAVNNYQTMNWQVRYGYMFKFGEKFRVMPQAGVAFNISSASKVNGYSATSAKYDKASATSALVAVPVILKLNRHIMLNATPEFHFTLSRSNTSEWISDFDSSYKGWTEGLGLQAGLMIFF